MTLRTTVSVAACCATARARDGGACLGDTFASADLASADRLGADGLRR